VGNPRSRHAGRVGWPLERLLVIDETRRPRGRPGPSSGTNALEEVDLDHVGIILGIRDEPAGGGRAATGTTLWKSALFDTLLADPEGSTPVELQRSTPPGTEGHDARRILHILPRADVPGTAQQARRCEVYLPSPSPAMSARRGRVRPPIPTHGSHEHIRCLRQVRGVGDVTAVLRYLVRNGIALEWAPLRPQPGPTRVAPAVPAHPCNASTTNPIYAGAYVLGQRPLIPGARSGPTGHRADEASCSQMGVLIKHLPAYISWIATANVERLAANRSGHLPWGPCARSVLARGLLVSRPCGSRNDVDYTDAIPVDLQLSTPGMELLRANVPDDGGPGYWTSW